MKHHYILYNDKSFGPYEDTDRMFRDFAQLVMVEKPVTGARWITVYDDGDGVVEDAQEEDAECNA